jgi:TolB-like protein
VLPFENLSPDAKDGYFAAGIHEEVLSQLAKLRNLTVISRTSVARYANTDLSVPQIAEELRVGAVMEGSVRYSNDRVRIQATLIDPTNDQSLWSDTYERDFADVFAIQADIAMNIANALETEFSSSSNRRSSESRRRHRLRMRSIWKREPFFGPPSPTIRRMRCLTEPSLSTRSSASPTGLKQSFTQYPSSIRQPARVWRPRTARHWKGGSASIHSALWPSIRPIRARATVRLTGSRYETASSSLRKLRIAANHLGQ